jgi:hypothetical protein
VLVIAPHVGRQEPLHPTAEVLVRARPERQMKMIWHDTKAKNPHRNPLTSKADQLDKTLVVFVLVEYLGLRVTSIDDVIADSSHRSSGRTWHTAIYRGLCPSSKRKVECPFSPFLFPFPLACEAVEAIEARPIDRLFRPHAACHNELDALRRAGTIVQGHSQ